MPGIGPKAMRAIEKVVQELHANSRACSFPAYHSAARWADNRLREWGIRARIFELPADGKSVFGDWRTPLAWRCAARRRILCSAGTNPAEAA